MKRFSRLLVIGFMMLVIGMFAAGIWFYRAQKAHYMNRIEQDLTAVAELKVKQIVDWRTERLVDAGALSNNSFFIDRVNAYLADPNPENAEPIISWFENLQHFYHYLDVMLLSPQGQVLISLRDSDVILHDHAMDTLKIALSSHAPTLTDLHMGDVESRPHVSIVAPLLRNDTTTWEVSAAVVMISDAQRFLFPLIQEWPTSSQTAETLLVEISGENVLFLNELRHKSNTTLRFGLPMTRNDLPAVMAAKGTTGIVQGKDYRDVDVLAALLPIPDSPWFMISKVDTKEAFAGWRYRSILIGLIMLGFLGFFGAFIFIIWLRNERVFFVSLYQSEASRREGEERLGITLKSIGDAVISTDKKGCVELLNPTAEVLTGWTNQDARGRPIESVFKIINQDTREPVENPVEIVFREGKIVGLANHTLLVSKDGTERPIADSGAPIRDSDHRIIGVVLVFRDMSKEYENQQVLLENHRSLQHLNAILRAIRNINHLITRENDRSRLIQGACDCIQETLSDSDSWIILLDHDRTPMGSAYAGNSFRSDQLRASVIEGWLLDCVLKTLNSENRLVISDFKDCNECLISNCDAQRALFSTRLEFRNKVYGVFSILVSSELASDYREQNLFVEVAGDIGFALWKIESEEIREKLEAKYSAALTTTSDAVLMTDLERVITMFNPGAEKLLGYQAEEVMGKPVYMLIPEEEIEKEHQIAETVLDRGTLKSVESERLTKDGQRIPVELTMNLRVDDNNRPIGFVSIWRDETERKQAESDKEKLTYQLIQAQKMESIGRLAGGVAHDFNNMLQIILGNVDLILDDLDPNSHLLESIKEVQKAAESSANLTRQLLAFARKQTMAPKVMDLNVIIAGMLKMLHRLIGENIELTWKPEPNLWLVNMDPSQVEQILANLIVNARDAIEETGRIVIETENFLIEEAPFMGKKEVVPGEYVRLTISDEGCGMDPETMAHIFEPFYSKKSHQEGTGLGLATVYGIVKQNTGLIDVYSEPGNGTVFKIYLPRIGEKMEQIPVHAQDQIPKGNSEKILMVEDDVAILKFGCKMLERLGYTVFAAATPILAIELAQLHAGEIDLLITDVVMPEMNGRDLADQLQTACPGLKVLYMSGYTADVIAHRGVLEKGVNFIPKPFSIREMAKKVRDCLD